MFKSSKQPFYKPPRSKAIQIYCFFRALTLCSSSYPYILKTWHYKINVSYANIIA